MGATRPKPLVFSGIDYYFFSNKRQFSCLSPRFLVILHTTSEDTFFRYLSR